MKKIVFMAMAVLCSLNIMADNVKFKINNMHCENCAKRVEKVLKANEAVSMVKVNLEEKTVCVSFDADKTNVEALKKALDEAKFQTEIAKQCKNGEGCKHKKENAANEVKAEKEEHKCGANGCGHKHENEEK